MLALELLVEQPVPHAPNVDDVARGVGGSELPPMCEQSGHHGKSSWGLYAAF
jgi:hypothetical protein